jgi:hypothetical protein
VELLYIVGGNLFLTYGLTRLTNRSPEQLRLDVEGVYTLWPGTAHVRHFRMRNESRAIQWALDVENADLTVDLVDLFHKKFHATRIRVEECSFRIRHKLSVEEADLPRAAAAAPIDGYADPPLLPIGPPDAPTTEENFQDWMAQLEDVVAGVREIWVDEWRLLGPAEARGSFFIKPGLLVQVGPASLEIRSGEVRIAERSALRGLDARLSVTIGATGMHEPVPRVARHISVSGQLDGQVPSIEFLKLYLGTKPPLRFEDGSGALHVEVDIANGRGMPKTAIRLESDRLALSTPKLGATVSFVLAARVEAGRKGTSASGELHVHEATLNRLGSTVAPPVVVDALVLFRGLPHDLAGPFSIEHTHLDVPVRVPDLSVFMPLPVAGRPAVVTIGGRGRLRAQIDLDSSFQAAGTVEARSERVEVASTALTTTFALSAQAGFDRADIHTRRLRLLPSSAVADELTVTRDGHTHRGGTVRVHVTRGRIRSGIPRDFALTVTATSPDLRWVAFDEPGKEGGGASAISAKANAWLVVPRPGALLDGSPAEAEVTGVLGVSVAAEGRFRDVAFRGNVTAASRIEGLDLGRRSLRLRSTHLVVRDLAIDRGGDHARGWWGSFDLPRIDLSVAGTTDLEAQVAARSKDGAPLLAALTSAGTIPGWAPSLFPMNGLTGSGELSRRRGIVDLAMSVASSSVDVRARLHDLGGRMDGAVLVETTPLILGVELTRGESHVHVFIGEDWLNAQIASVSRKEAADEAAPPSSR